jgi:tetratricopeptide (TPR) repeat protein
MRTSARTLVLLLFVALAGGRAVAADVAGAKAAFLEGERQFKLGRFTDAIAAYERAFSLDPRPAFLHNMALAHRRQFENDGDVEQLVQARTLYRNYLLLDPKTPRRAAVEQILVELNAQIESEQRKRAAAAAPPPVVQPAPAPAPPVAQPTPAPAALVSTPPPRDRHVGWIVGGTIGAAIVVGGAIALAVVLTRPQPLTVDLSGTPR